MQFIKYKIFFILLFLSADLSYAFQDKNNFSISDSLAIAKKYYINGIYYGNKGKLDSALFFAQKAVKLYNSVSQKENTNLANAYQSLGIINKLLGKYDDAIRCYNNAERIYTIKSNKSFIAYIYANKANIYFIQQDYTKAKDYHLRALNIFKKDSLRFKNQIASTYTNLGNIFRRNIDYPTAIQYYKKSLKLKDLKASYTTFGNLALCYKKIGEYNQAKQYYLKAITIIEAEFGKKNIKNAVYILNYGNFLSNQNNKGDAFKFFKSAIEIYKNNYGSNHPNLSGCYNDLGVHFLSNNQTDSALFYFQKSLIALSPEFNDVNVNSNPSVKNVLSKTHLLSSLKNKATALSILADKNNEPNKYILSLATYDLAINAIDKIRLGYLSEESKLFLADNEFETFSNALEIAFKLYKSTGEEIYLEKAFNYSESGKSAILTEALKNIQALNIGGIPDSLITKEKQLEKNIWSYEELIYEENKKKDPDNNKLEYWNKFLFEEKQEFDKLTIYLENNFTKYQTLKHLKNTTTIEEVQNKLSRKDILIEYFFTNDKIYTIIIDQTESDILVQNIDQIFHDHLNRLLQSLSNNNFSNHGYKEFNQYHESSFYIYNQLLKSIESKIKNKELIIIPDGKLAYLPFEVLTTNKDTFNRINYNKLPYLLYNNTFSYSYSASFLFEENNREEKNLIKLAGFAPSYANIEGVQNEKFSFRQKYREKLFPLKGIKEEVEVISNLIGGDVYVDNKASEANFKKKACNYDILHLAMHTIIDDTNPMYSKMVFTQTNDSAEDGFLNTFELYNMNLNARMAVLSSCNSGSGIMHRGEGVLSMARGFVYSGCPSIIMTLWSVEDNSGVKLMTSFYSILLKGNNKSHSLRQSKIDFIKNADQLKSHPYFWSGYVVIGNKEALFFPYKKYILFSGLFLLLITVGIFLKRFWKS
ncbi:MAG: CHAT domain-containing protein [Bacteroidales bacterium]|nr:CHAT domain-containing protein [Bacteroidales bacterium]